MKTRVEMHYAVQLNVADYYSGLRDALDEAVKGVAHDAVAALLKNDEYPGDDEYNELLSRVREVAQAALIGELRRC